MASWLRGFPPWVKTVLVLGGGLLIGVSTYRVLSYLEKRELRLQDEGFDEESRLEEIPEKKVVVLGLEGAGKSTFIANLSRVESDDMKPTQGFHVTSVNTEDTCINIWERGADSCRSYWGNFLQDTDTLVYVVDSNDSKRLPQAYDEFKKLMTDHRLKDVPVLVLASKQDVPASMTATDIEHALNLKNSSLKQPKVKVLPLQVYKTKPQHPSVKEAEDAMIQFAFTK